MRNIRRVSYFLLLVIGLQSLSGCYGKFALVNMLYKWNGELAGKELGGKFINSVAFFVLLVVPVYELFGLVDWVILNAIEFWTGTNPVAMKEGEKEIQMVRYGDRAFEMTATKNKMEIKELSGKNKGRTYNLEFNNADHSISILKDGQAIKVADFESVDYNMAYTKSLQTNY